MNYKGMQVIIRGIEQECTTLRLSAEATCTELYEAVEGALGYGACISLWHGGRRLPSCGDCLSCWGVASGGRLEAVPRLCGGGTANKNQMDPTFQALANKYNIEKRVCRRCYATTHKNAFTCRKRKCGRCADLRPKKVGNR